MNDFFQNIAQREFQTTSQQLTSAKQVQVALKASYARQDKIIATSLQEAKRDLACKAGCAFCCYYKVEVRAHEVFAITTYVQKNLDAEQRQALVKQVQENAAIIRQLTPQQHLTTNLKCPLLQDNRCSVYPVRPYRCRNFHATDAQACESSFADPANMDISTGMIEIVALAADAHTQGFEAAVAQQGLDPRVYDFNTALLEALTDAHCEKRYGRGKKAFQRAIEVLD